MSTNTSAFAPLEIQRVGIVVGESSGDILGAGLVSALKQRFPDCVFEGLGGPKMLALGFRSFFQMDRLAVMGLIDPLKRLPELLAMRKSLKQHFLDNPPDIFIGIDAPDFNLSLEQALREQGIVTAHYVSPSVWAWRQGRIKKIARAVDLMLTLFPFEARFYKQHKVAVEYVGHTLADQIPLETNVLDAQKKLGVNADGKHTLIALLPGSRAGEVNYLCRTFLQAAERVFASDDNTVFLIPAANEARRKQIEIVLKEFPALPVKLFLRQSHEVMAASNLVVMASGTTSLEAMLLKKPMVIAYKMASLSFAILRRLVKSPFVGLPNLLAGKMLVPELLQKDATADNIASQIHLFLEDGVRLERLQREYTEIHLDLKKNADHSAAEAICHLLVKKRLKIDGEIPHGE
ncbi:lipid-A-disaccharide synthase [Alteromonadaceae bacterium Bs31]|nr:lipid-A-disaccharide synthase [Alteromonadaceae bacterium Bs31]